MTTSDASARPPRWIRTLPWLAGLMLGTTAHIVWWTGQLDRGERRVEVIEVSAPPVTVHVRSPRTPVVHHVTTGSARPRRGHHDHHDHHASRWTPTTGARGAVVCHLGSCTLRRSFVRRLVNEPEWLDPGPRLVPRLDGDTLTSIEVHDVFPGSLADLLGLVSGDEIVALDGQPLGTLDAFARRAQRALEADALTITLEHADVVRTMQYRLIDG
ncbi:MAG: hypothetical protein H6712_12970 [Myxococcales bacterium]|nr:hypothetical protein [Myxococcales bacterium]